jgi:1-aminocyclopropane-1-carboxylate deaminase
MQNLFKKWHNLYDINKDIPINKLIIPHYNSGIDWDIKRLDLIHPFLSGNKWFKLKYLIYHAIATESKGIISFGGAYSNHLAALSWICKHFEIPFVAMVRGEISDTPSDTLQWMQHYGAKIEFVPRGDYKQKNDITFIQNVKKNYPGYFFVPEGGNHPLGIKGAAEMLTSQEIETYDGFAISYGSGASSKGLSIALNKKKPLISIASLKGMLAVEELDNQWKLVIQNQFGGFGRSNDALERFIVDFTEQNPEIPVDRVYNAKSLGTLSEISVKMNSLKPKQKWLYIHTGGIVPAFPALIHKL